MAKYKECITALKDQHVIFQNLPQNHEEMEGIKRKMDRV
jgi:hypothetical protein